MKPYREARHLIVDIETLGVTVPAPVLSIGIVSLDLAGRDIHHLPPEAKQTFTIGVDPAQCVGTPEEATLAWWNQRPEEVRNAVWNAPKSADPFGELLQIIEKVNPDYFWGKAPDFDFGHLAAQLKHLGKPVPWKFWQLRDIRTLEGLELSRSQQYMHDKNSLAKHVALDDAIAESELLLESIRMADLGHQALVSVKHLQRGLTGIQFVETIRRETAATPNAASQPAVSA